MAPGAGLGGRAVPFTLDARLDEVALAPRGAGGQASG